jgi:hypothetical protein
MTRMRTPLDYIIPKRPEPFKGEREIVACYWQRALHGEGEGLYPDVEVCFGSPEYIRFLRQIGNDVS